MTNGIVTFTPASPVTAAGIVVTGTTGADVFFEAFASGAISLGVFGPVSFPSENGPVTEDRFFGISFPGGIESFTITTSGGPLEVDHVQYGNAAAVNTNPFINSNGGDITVSAADVELVSTINAGGGVVTLEPTAGNTIDLGATGGTGQFVVTDSEFDLISTTSGINIGNVSSGDVTFTGSFTMSNATTLAVITGGTINDTGSVSTFADANLSLSAALGIGTTSEFNIDADNIAASVGSGALRIADSANIVISTVGGIAGLTSAGNGDVSLTAGGSIVVSQAVQAAGSGNVSLTTSGLIGSNISPNAPITTDTGNLTIAASNNVVGDVSTITTSSGIVTIRADVDSDGTGFIQMLNPISLGSGTLVIDTPNDSTTFSGPVSGSGSLTKTGAGSIALPGNSTYTGATSVSQGTLLVNGSLSATNVVTVATGATLGGSGTINGTVTVNGALAPGSSPGILSTGDVTFANGSAFNVEIEGTSPGSGHDQLAVTGTVNLGGATLNGTLSQAASAGSEFTVINNDSTDPITGTFAGLAEGAFVDLNIFNGEVVTGTQRFVISYVRGTGNDVTLRPASTITGRVFNDVNFDGIDNDGNNSVNNSTVRLIAQNGTTVVRTTTTAADGSYTFSGLVPGAYFVEFVAPTAFHFTLRDVGGNDAIDSDANQTTGRTTLLTASPSGTVISDVDAGVKAAGISINNVQQLEGGFGQQTAFSFSVSLSGIAQQVTTADFATANDTATIADSDYTAKNGTVTFAIGQQTRTITVVVTGDSTIEANETFFVNLSNAVNASIVTSQGVGTITNDDTVVPNISITNVASNEGNDPETTQFDFTVSLNYATTEPISVTYSTIDGTATVVDGDYNAMSGTVTFLPGETESMFSVTVRGDDVIEDDETFSVRLSNVTGNAVIADDTGIGTIINDDFATPQLTITDVTVEEGGIGARTNLLFKVRLSSVALIQTTVDFSTESDDALAGSDFEAVSGTLTFLPDDLEKTIVVNALGDINFEIDETFFVNLLNASGATIADSQGVGTIQNDDLALQDISITDISISEGATGSTTRVEVAVNLSGPSATSVSVDFATANGTAIVGQDYTARTGTITFSSGEQQKLIAIDITGDATLESNEQLFVNLFNPVNGNIIDTQGVVTILNDDAAIPNLTISDVTINEGALGNRTQLDFNVSLSGPSTQPVSYNFATADGTARIVEGDYETISVSRTITPGNTLQTVTVIVLGDLDVEGDEFLFVNLSSVVGANVLDGQGRGLILNDDAVIPNISIGDIQVIEGSTGQREQAFFTIALSGPTTTDVTVNYETAFGLAVSDPSMAIIPTSLADYLAAAGTVTIPAGEVSVQVPVVVLGDTEVESNEFFFLNLSNPIGGVLVDDQGQATILNDDLDVQSLSVSDVTLPEGLAGARTAFTFTVSLSGPSSAPVTAGFATANGSATASSGDFSASSGTLTFAPGETTKTVIVTVNGDTTNEADEQFFLNLSNVVGATVDDGQGRGTILNDDSPVPTLQINDVSRVEGGAGVRNRFDFALSLSNPSAVPVTVNAMTLGGTATAGVDFETVSRTVTFAPGETMASLTVTVLGDFSEEANETFFVNLSGAVSATLIDDQALGTIRNDDITIPGIRIDDAIVTEGISGQRPQISFVVSLSGPASVPVEVDFSTMGATATSDIDFVASSGKLRFEPGEITRIVQVTVLGDPDVEANETLFLNLSNPVNGLLTDDQGVGIIVNDDAAPTLSISSISALEGAAGQRTQFAFNVTLTGLSSNPVTVDFASANGTATAGSLDYMPVNGTLTFLPGEATKQIIVNVAGDAVVETDEFFYVNLSGAIGANVLVNQAIGTITNDDAPNPVLSIEDFATDEGITGARTRFEFNARLSSPSTQRVSVDFSTADGTATSSGTTPDFVAQSDTLTFEPGETSKFIIVNVLGDATFESLETFFVNLSNAQGLTIADDQAVGRIVNDDSPTPVLTVTDGSLEEGIVGERRGLTFNLALSSPPAATVTVDFATADGTAALFNQDYVAQSGTVTFLPGQQTATVVVTVVGDATVETNETFFLNLTNLTGNAVLGNDQGTGTIRNDDVILPGITISDAALAEGVPSQRTRFVFDVSLSTPVTAATGPVTVQYQTSNGTATGTVGGVFDAFGNRIISPGADYEDQTGSLIFQPGEQTKQIVVIVSGDATVEANDTFFVNLTSSSPNSMIVDDQALATILNDDFELPGVRVSDASVVEGGAGQRTLIDVELSLSAPASSSVFVNYSTSNGSMTLAGLDYESRTGTVEFMPTELVKTVRLTILGDGTEEADETFFLNLTGVSSNAMLADDQAAVTIVNDDVLLINPDISISDVTQVEGNNGALSDFQFLVSLSAAASAPVTVDFSTAEGTANSSDFIARSSTLTFQPGETTKTVNVSVRGDQDVESDEMYFVDLRNAAGGVIVDAQGQGTIVNDDVAMMPGIRIDDVTREEGSSGDITEFTFTVQLTGVFNKPVEASYFTSQFSASSAAVDRDFFRISNLSDPASISRLIFEPGETIQTITVQVVGDSEVEPDETFFVNLFDPTNARLDDDQGVGTIVNDDQPLPQVEISDAIALEGDSSTTMFNFTVTLDRESDTVTTVDFSTANGTTGTSADGDVQATSGTVTFNPGETEKTITVLVVGDLVDEVDEQFFVNLTNPVGLLITDDQGLGVILDDDDANAILAVTDAVNLNSNLGKEGNTGTVTYEFTVQLIGKPAGPVTVQVTTQNGTAISGQDYNPVTQLLTFNTGEATKKVQVTVLSDRTVEPDEKFFLNLSNPVGATIFNNQGVATIVNDDDVVLRDEGLALTDQITDLVNDALADPTIDSSVPQNGISVVKGVNSGGRSDITELLVQIGLDVIARLGLTDAIVAVFDPVNFIVTTPEGRANGFTENSGVVGQSTNSFYSGDGAVELLVIPNASAGIYNLELAGVNNGTFRAAVSRVDGSGVIGTETIEGTLASQLELALDFTRSFPNNQSGNDEAAQAFLALFQQFGGDSDAIALALATLTHSPGSNADQEQLDNQNDASAQLQAAAAAVLAHAKLFANALQGALPDWVDSGLAGAFGQSNLTARGVETGSDSSSAMRDFFWESVGRGVLGLPGGVTDVLDLLNPLMPTSDETKTASDEADGNDTENDGTPATDGDEESKKERADAPRVRDEEIRRAMLRKRDDDEVALYVPAAAFAGPEWLSTAEAASAKSSSRQNTAAARQKFERQSDSRAEATPDARDAVSNNDSVATAESDSSGTDE
ncbi:MAG: autotransporter-associated beta strand repeat-containing protein [Planctomycetota bacterium]|nr:autotransporter-associated beta strand repeat-containing protein [Planctomycetota bacterium]